MGFPDESASGPLQEPKKWVNAIRIATGLKAGLHDLRRTFATVGVSINIDPSIVQQLLNHRPGREAIFNYVILDVEQLRDPIQRIADRLVEQIHRPRADTAVKPPLLAGDSVVRIV